MAKVVSYSLFPSAGPDYTGGVDSYFIRGLEWQIVTVPVYYPDWEIWLYISNKCNADLKAKYSNAVKVIEIEDTEEWAGSLWRFYPIAEPSVERFLSRDLDAMIEPREVAAVLEWCKTDYDYHIMRDHDCHNVPIMGGMWGAIGNKPELRKTIDDFISANPVMKTDDQKFLKEYIWPNAKDHCIAHDEIYWEQYKCALIKEFPPHPMSHRVTSDIIIDGKNLRTDRKTNLWKMEELVKLQYTESEDGVLFKARKL